MGAFYLVSELQFIDPLNRRDLTRDELILLDAYLKRHRLKEMKVVEAYDDRGLSVSKASARGQTVEGRLRIRQEEARQLLNSLFGDRTFRALNDEHRNDAQSSVPEQLPYDLWNHDDGMYADVGMVLIDDDVNPGLRGGIPPPSSTETHQPQASTHTLSSTPFLSIWTTDALRIHGSTSPNHTELFPVLPTIQSTGEMQELNTGKSYAAAVVDKVRTRRLDTRVEVVEAKKEKRWGLLILLGKS